MNPLSRPEGDSSPERELWGTEGGEEDGGRKKPLHCR